MDQSELENIWAETGGNIWDANVDWGTRNVVSSPPLWQKEKKKPIGLVYLTPSRHVWDPLHVGELSIGIIIQPEYRGKGYAREAVSQVTSIAFSHGHCHRLQAILLGHVAMDRALSLFTKMQVPFTPITFRLFLTFCFVYRSFAHEGTRRRAFFSPMEHEWKDATYMAILDTDWVMRNVRVYQPAPKSLWDALFARHQREREELLRWDAKVLLKRTSSMATIRGSDAALTAISDSAPTPTSASEMEFDDTSDPNRKRKADSSDIPSDMLPVDKHTSCVSSTESRRHLADQIVNRVQRWVELSSSELSFDDSLNDRYARLASDDSSASSPTSWDEMDLETSTTDSLPSHASSNSSLFEFIDE